MWPDLLKILVEHDTFQNNKYRLKKLQGW